VHDAGNKLFAFAEFFVIIAPGCWLVTFLWLSRVQNNESLFIRMPPRCLARESRLEDEHDSATPISFDFLYGRDR
jgi:hypothetical protein